MYWGTLQRLEALAASLPHKPSFWTSRKKTRSTSRSWAKWSGVFRLTQSKFLAYYIVYLYTNTESERPATLLCPVSSGQKSRFFAQPMLTNKCQRKYFLINLPTLCLAFSFIELLYFCSWMLQTAVESNRDFSHSLWWQTNVNLNIFFINLVHTSLPFCMAW